MQLSDAVEAGIESTKNGLWWRENNTSVGARKDLWLDRLVHRQVGFYVVLATQHSTGSFPTQFGKTTDARLENLGSTTTMAVAFDKLHHQHDLQLLCTESLVEIRFWPNNTSSSQLMIERRQKLCFGNSNFGTTTETTMTMNATPIAWEMLHPYYPCRMVKRTFTSSAMV